MSASYLKQSTASQSRAIGPFLDDTDFKTAETGLTIANTDIKLVINGAASANKNSGGGTHRVNGVYSITFDATDTATVGEMEVSVVVAGALPVFHKFWVLEEAVYDALFGASALGYIANAPVNVAQFGGSNGTFSSGRPEVNTTHAAGTAWGSGAITAAAIADGAIDRATFAADTGLQSIRSGTAQAGASGTITLDASAHATSGFYTGKVLYIVGGTGVGQSRMLISYNGGTKVAAVAPNWTVTPDNTSVFAILPCGPSDIESLNHTQLTTSIAQIGVNVVQVNGTAITAAGGQPYLGIVDQGTAQSATGTTLVLRSAAAFADDELIGNYITITGGSTGVGQTRQITDYVSSTDTATVDTWTTTPTGTITYQIRPAVAGGGGGGLDAAGVRAAVGLASANLDTQLSAIDTVVDSILVDTAEIGAAGAGLTALASASALATVDSEVGDILTDTGTTIPAQIAALNNLSAAQVNAEVDTALADINLDHLVKTAVDTDWATTVHLNSVIGHVADNGTSATFDRTTDSLEALQAEHDATQSALTTIDNEIAVIDGNVDSILVDTAEIGAAGAGLTALATQASVNTIDDFLDTEVAAILAAVDTEVAAILADTNELQTDWANGGRLDLILDARASQSSVDTIDTEVGVIDGLIDTIKVTTDKIDDTLEDDAGTYRFTTNALEQAPTGGSAPSAADIADAVWDEVLSGHLTGGSTGNALNAAGSAGDPWTTALPGAYGAGTAGKIIGDNINATISSRASQASVDTIDDFLDTEVAAILADTNELQTDWANGGRLDLILDARASQASVDDLPTNAELTTALGTADDATLAQIALVKAKTDLIPASPAAVGSAMTLAADSVNAAALAADAVAEINATVDAALADYDAPTRAELTTDTNSILTAVGDVPTNAELATALASADDATLAAIAALNNLSESGVRTALGMASANLDTQLADLPTNAELTTALGTADDAVLAAVAALNNLDATQVQTAAAAALTAYDPPTRAELTSDTNSILTAVGDVPTNAELATALGTADDAVLAQVALVKAQTDQLTFTEAGNVDANVKYVHDIEIDGSGTSGDPWGPI